MRCPFCQSDDTQVKDSRPAEDGAVIRRRRVCPVCAGRFTTFERVQLRDLMVLKKSGRKVPFDRDKLTRSIQVALRKRDADPERVERAISGIVRQLESSGEAEIHSDEIGRLAMDALKGIDDIAYIRFASVYRNFSEALDFHNVIDELNDDAPAAPAVKQTDD
ncbi:transcriptional repressor NrdR [Paenochrobactrum gallinarii]|uniref:Transcriptional repressor NrdR n=1 Tax=Paenochrobactrum gallinarii TaxID=643673 RepID=A0A841LSX4_9HYPH|nr:transcriptional regulator NrdR [Paenochrobactrum gallinarii]MBB6259577.1 transcriptional repressor NrdR [Paenochrobactrum gallinarii]